MEELRPKSSEEFIPSISHIQLDATQNTAECNLFTRSIAHDLNGLLLTIMGFTDLALDDVPHGTLAHANIEQALKASRNAKALVQRLLTVDRSTHQELHLVALNRVIQEALPVLRTPSPPCASSAIRS